MSLLLGSPATSSPGLEENYLEEIGCAPAGKTAGLESHGLNGAVTCKDHKVSPGKFLAVFLLDGPEQAACLIEVYIVRPAVERR